jgi:hypothetical protein
MEQTRKSTEFCEKISWNTEDREEQLSDGSYERTTLDLRISATLNKLRRRASASIQVFLFTLSFIYYNTSDHLFSYGTSEA